MKLTPAQMRIAAKMCDERKASMNADSTPDEVEAMAWLFDNGIFFLGTTGCDMCAAMLREEADNQEKETQ